MGGEAEQVDLVVLDVQRDFADGLGGVGVEEDASVVAEPADLADRVERADLVVRGHDRDEDRAVGQRGLDRLGRDQAGRVGRQDGHIPAVLAGEPFQGVEHGLVLDRRRDDVVPLPLQGGQGPFQGEVVRLGRARGEDDLLGLRPDQPGHLLARRIDGLGGLPAEAVGDAGGVAVALGEDRAASPRRREGRSGSSRDCPGRSAGSAPIISFLQESC